MALLILLSLGGNIWQINRNSQLKDNDLKYRYIKSTNGITLGNLYKLENIFHFNPDEKLIREIRQNVENWEKTIQKSAEKVEHENTKLQIKKMIGRWIRITTQRTNFNI